MGRITEPIQPQAFEIIRDRIFEIIADELYQQAAINYDDELDANVYLERAVPINQSECPAVNIYLTQGSYLDESKNTARGEYTYAVDIYTKASSVAGTRGDLIASERMGRIMGAIRAIIMDHNYITLQFARPFIENVRVEGFSIANPSETKDAANMVLGRLLIKVRATQSVQNYPPSTLDGYDTQVQISESAQGYLYSGNNATPAEPVCPGVSLLVNTVSFADVNSGATFDITVVDTAGNDPVVSIAGSTVTVAAAVTCQPANVINSDGSYDVDVASGGTLNLPDISFTDSDGVVSSVPAQTDILASSCPALPDIAPLRYKLTQAATSGYDYDEYWHAVNGTFDYSYSASTKTQMLDPDRTDKIFYDDSSATGISQHKFRFVGSLGGYYDDSDGNYYDIDGVLSDRDTEFLLSGSYYIIDRLTWCGHRGTRGGSLTLNALLATLPTTYSGFSDFYVPPISYLYGLVRYDVNLQLYLSDRPPFDIQLTPWSCTFESGLTLGIYLNSIGTVQESPITSARQGNYIRVHNWGTDDSI